MLTKPKGIVASQLLKNSHMKQHEDGCVRMSNAA